jgi:acyl-CoA thioester hydrolase
LAWVVLRHEIDYHAPALPGDTIVATTWVEGWKGVRSERRVQLHERSSGKLLAEAKTIWVLLDAQTRRPKRIEDALGGLLTGAKEA